MIYYESMAWISKGNPASGNGYDFDGCKKDIFLASQKNVSLDIATRMSEKTSIGVMTFFKVRICIELRCQIIV